MRLSVTSLAILGPFLVSAAPIRRAASATDLLVLNFASVLENLETQFYTQALQKFQESDFINAGFSSAAVAIEQIQSIMSDEAFHVQGIAEIIPALGGQVITGCNFDFSTALTDVPTMLGVARVVEMTGVSAYLGAASLVDDPQLLTTAASILTVEARHQTVLNILSGTGSAIPQALDIPLSPQQVLAIASPFISGCDVGVPANPTLQVTNTGTPTTGTTLTFSSNGIQGLDPSTLSCQMMVGGAPFAISLPYSQCVVPGGINGPVALYITNTTQPLANDLTVQFGGSVVAGPTFAFIDIDPQTLPALARNMNVTITDSSTISPDQASSIMASATITGSSGSPTGSVTDLPIAAPTGTDVIGSSTSTATDASGSPAPTAPANVAGGVVGGDLSDIQTPGGANNFTGNSGDGNLSVIGWSSVPLPTTTPSS
ncbi:hypothetical protein SISNIDRAFT_449685 [Sistotremastrum niveocremeum HHB9708]|uniref:Ferritin-like domain-containing protein n=2 Tax=Sistotremastraceae TaxID=3402574 RepID=A0A164ZTT0_9AGAM|nr:hypothetical protein SISNIDRAFT_449685 [Sistotremastrum niveocremeum HHB9708]KZT38333.1 hypothetical protein SISSUDRAFT_1047140 [Sistotremastrum suecicum HHB10207 ss-3]